MWTCPNCKRQFKNNNQSHGCHQITMESLLQKRSSTIGHLYKEFHSYLSFSDYRREVVPPDVIFYKTSSTFLAVKLKTRWIEIEFFLDYYLDHPVIKKWLQTSKRRYVYVIAIDEGSDITKELLGWVEYSYQLINNL